MKLKQRISVELLKEIWMWDFGHLPKIYEASSKSEIAILPQFVCQVAIFASTTLRPCMQDRQELVLVFACLHKPPICIHDTMGGPTSEAGFRFDSVQQT